MKMLRALAMAAATLAVGSAVPAVGQGRSLAMLDRLDHGAWELRFRGNDDGLRRICLSDGNDLIQLQHPSAKCSRIIIEDTPSEVTVQYTCPGKGYGRTNIRRESGRLIQIDSQGIANGLPFAFAAEARLVGSCGK